jgi:cytosine/adenosine deaminase-related metal-dependent hydrolase
MICTCCANGLHGISFNRRAMLAGLATVSLSGTATVPKPAFAADTVPVQSRNRILIKGGDVLTLEKTVGDMAGADVLIEGPTIVAIGRNIEAADAEIVDAAGMIVMPGFIDSHRHTWQTALRSYVAQSNYYQIVLTTLGPLYRPEDVYIGNLLGATGALNSGITTMLDWSHIINSPAHADAAIKGLADSGIRGIFAHGVAQIGRSSGATGQPNSQKHSEDIRRVQKQYFRTDDQLLTLALAFGGVEFSSLEETVKDVALARELGIRMTTHVGVIPNMQAVTRMKEAGLLGPDINYVHATSCSDDEIKMIADSGGTLSISPLNEKLPGLDTWLKHDLRPSLSLDTETRAPGDLFTQMRALLWHEWNTKRERPGEALGKYRDVLEFATIQGARATGLERKTGSLAVGKRADVILIDRNDISMIPRTGDPAASVVLVGQPSHVKWVLVDGKVCKRDGRLVGVDVGKLQTLAQASHDYLIETAKLKSQN